jgi:hypothetical protein
MSLENSIPALSATKSMGNQVLPYSKSHFEVQRRPDRQLHQQWLCLAQMLVI